MRRWILTSGLLGLALGLLGCGGSEAPKKEAEPKTVKAPELGPGGP